MVLSEGSAGVFGREEIDTDDECVCNFRGVVSSFILP